MFESNLVASLINDAVEADLEDRVVESRVTLLNFI